MVFPWYRHVMMLAVCAGVMAAHAVAAEVVSAARSQPCRSRTGKPVQEPGGRTDR